MQNLNRPNSEISPLQVIQAGAVVSVVLLVIILWVYFFQPLSEALSPFWNDKLIDILVLIPALGSAVAGVLLMSQFEKREIPYHIWQAFTIGLWCWVAGEITGMVNDAIYWDTTYPDFRLVDVFWLFGYFFLGLSLYYQLRLVYGAKTRSRRRIYLGLVALALLVTAGLTNLAEKAGLGRRLRLDHFIRHRAVSRFRRDGGNGRDLAFLPLWARTMEPPLVGLDPFRTGRQHWHVLLAGWL